MSCCDPVTFKSDWPQVWSEMRERVRHQTSYQVHLWLLGVVLLLIVAAAIASPSTIDLPRVVIALTTFTALVLLICRCIRIYFYTPQTREEKLKKFLLDLDFSLVTKFEKNFASDNLDEAEIILLGQAHIDELTDIQCVFTQMFWKNGQNIILSEGRDKNKPPTTFTFEKSTVESWGWDDGEAFQYCAKVIIGEIPGRVDDAAWKEKEKMRDESLVEAVREHSRASPQSKIFVIGGSSHVPITLLETFKGKKVLLLHLEKAQTPEDNKRWMERLRKLAHTS